MKLFLSQKADIQSENPQEKLSKLIEVFANYVRAPQRNLVNINMVSKADQDALKIAQVSKFNPSTMHFRDLVIFWSVHLNG